MAKIRSLNPRQNGKAPNSSVSFPSDRTQSWADTVPANVLRQVGGYAIIHTTNPRPRWRSWLSDTKEAAGEIKAIYSQF